MALERMAAAMDYSTLCKVFARFEAAEPNPVGELVHHNAFTLLVAVVLSAQATDAGVNRATAELFRLAATPQAMLDLGEERVTEHIRTIGLYRNKAKNVIKLSRILVEQLWRRGAGEPRRAHRLARRRAQDRERGAEQLVRTPLAGRRHPHLPGRKPDRYRAGP